MNIFYNYELSEEVPLVMANPNHKTILKEIRDFIKDKLINLESQINKEEMERHCLTVIFIPTNKSNYEGVKHEGYSKELTEKMFNCLKPEDFIHLQIKLVGLSGLN